MRRIFDPDRPPQVDGNLIEQQYGHLNRPRHERNCTRIWQRKIVAPGEPFRGPGLPLSSQYLWLGRPSHDPRSPTSNRTSTCPVARLRDK
jgi:hypothetical protein